MGKKRVLVPAEDLDLSAVQYEPEAIRAPHLTGFLFKVFVGILEMPVFGPLIVSILRKRNNIDELLQNTVIPETPMFKPEFPPQEAEPVVSTFDEDGRPEARVELALKCLPHYDPATHTEHIGKLYLTSTHPYLNDQFLSFRYWKIRDYAYAYRSRLVTPSMVAEQIILVIKDINPLAHLLISFDAEEVMKQAAASTQRFEQGNPLSILDGIFIAIKDDIDCLPHPTTGGSTWMHEVRTVRKDADSVSKLRRCGVIFLGKANMHELGMGTTGNNPNYRTTRNPHAPEMYTGGSSSGSAALVASGLCSAALGTDAGGSVRIPASLCGVVGLKTTYGRTSIKGSLCDAGTVEIIGPIASSVEDIMLVYAAILGSSPEDRICLKPALPCLPILSSHDNLNILGSLRLGKYSPWFNDVNSPDISDKCEDILNQITNTHGCEIMEVTIPELHEMRTAHLVTVGSGFFASINPDYEDGKGKRLTYDTRTSTIIFRSFTASDYLAAQCLRRRIMHHHMEIFKKVDVIVTPTTGMTAPPIPPNADKYGETNLPVTGYLMRFILAANLLGLPAISVPIGYDKEGLPIGLQLIGRPWGEATILRLASAIEELCGNSKRPVTFYDVLSSDYREFHSLSDLSDILF